MCILHSAFIPTRRNGCKDTSYHARKWISLIPKPTLLKGSESLHMLIFIKNKYLIKSQALVFMSAWVRIQNRWRFNSQTPHCPQRAASIYQHIQECNSVPVPEQETIQSPTLPLLQTYWQLWCQTLASASKRGSYWISRDCLKRKCQGLLQHRPQRAKQRCGEKLSRSSPALASWGFTLSGKSSSS